MATARTDVLSDNLSVIKALLQEYSKKEELDLIASVEQDVAEVHRLCNTREGEVKSIIRELSRQVEGLQCQAQYPYKEGANQQLVEQLQHNLQEARSAIDKLGNETRDVEAHRQKLEEHLAQAKERLAALTALEASEEPFLKYHLSLYAHISKITWKVDDEHLVAGTVSQLRPDGGGDLHSFSFNRDTLSTTQIVNAVWEALA